MVILIIVDSHTYLDQDKNKYNVIINCWAIVLRQIIGKFLTFYQINLLRYMLFTCNAFSPKLSNFSQYRNKLVISRM